MLVNIFVAEFINQGRQYLRAYSFSKCLSWSQAESDRKILSLAQNWHKLEDL
jgi:hypothetical protein